MPANEPTPKLVQFAGLNTVDSKHTVGLKGLLVADNIDIDNDGKRISRRAGYEKVFDAPIDAAWGDDGILLLRSAGNLYRYTPGASSVLLRSGCTGTGDLCGLTFNGRTYWSDGTDTGVIENGLNRSFGLEVPSRITAVAGSGGQLSAGWYLLSATFVREDDQESGAPLSTTIELTEDGSSITVTLPLSSDVTVDRVRLYMSEPNGQALYFVGETFNGLSTYLINGVPGTTQRLAGQFKGPPPAFSQITHWNGYLSVAHKTHVYFSEPLNYELFDPLAAFTYDGFMVNVVGALEGGLLVGTEKSIYWQTSERLRKLAPYGAVPGTWLMVPGSVIGKGEIADICGMFMSKKGICVVYPDGQFRNVSEQRVTGFDAVRGTAMLRERLGQRHYVSVLQS